MSLKKADLKCGDFIQAKTGELLQVNALDDDRFQFQLYDPTTKKITEYCMEGDSKELDSFFIDTGMEKVGKPE